MITSNVIAAPVMQHATAATRSDTAFHAVEPLTVAIDALVPHGTTNVPSPDGARVALEQATFAVKVLGLANTSADDPWAGVVTQAIDKVAAGTAQLQQFLALADPWRAPNASALSHAAQQDFRDASVLAASA